LIAVARCCWPAPLWPIIRSPRVRHPADHAVGNGDEVEWVQPHVYVYLDVKDAGGG
jgi:hypothetical protein